MDASLHPHWTPNPQPDSPGPGEVHLWSVSLEISEAIQAALTAILSDDEQRRASRFLFEDDRRRFTACRGRLRRLLAKYMHTPPERLEFAYSGLGKPTLATGAGDPPLHFNVSHSGELALIAITREGELGADVERRRELRDMQGLAERFFSQAESSGLLALDPKSQPSAFFQIWTRKEAILKATGKGLTFPLNRLTVTFGENTPPKLLQLGDNPEEARCWTLQALSPAPDYVAAIATRYQPVRFCYWLWQDDVESS